MKTTNRNAAEKRNCKVQIFELPQNCILSSEEMRCVRGGDGEGSGCEPIIIIPPKSD